MTLDVSAGIEYGLLDELDFDPMAALIAETFSRFEPPAVAAGLSAADIGRLVSAFRLKALTERLTIMARKAVTGELLGALLTEDFGTPPPTGLEESVPRFAPVGALLDGLDRRYRETRTVVAGSHIHLFMLAVAAPAAGRGIAGRLVGTCLENGKARDYRFAVTEATGNVSQHVFRKMGFRDLFSTPYATFRFEGRSPFAAIAEHEGTILMEREL